jgi:hypothetical protein
MRIAVKDWFERIKFSWQRAYRGYDDSAWWSLDIYLAKTAAPILQQMADRCPGYPHDLTSEEWTEMLQKMATAMQLIAADTCNYTKEENAAIDEGVALFGKWYRNLWT